MPIYETEELSKDELYEQRRRNVCVECGAMLNVFYDDEEHKAFLACNDWPRTHHEGVAREFRSKERNIPTRREEMTEEFGPGKTKALAKFIGAGVITRNVAEEIVESLWGEAPPIEKAKAIMLCHQYNLNPLMKHIFMVGYKKKDEKGYYIKDGKGGYEKNWTIIQGIVATRLIASRNHSPTYLDMTPRKASQKEIDRILGDEADDGQVYGFVHIRDTVTGTEAYGLKGWKRSEEVKGAEKGNTPLNMACIRAERQAYDRLYPGEMPPLSDVVDERYAETGNTIEGEFTELPLEKEAPKSKSSPPKSHPGPAASPPANCATPAQLNKIRADADKMGYKPDELNTLVEWKFPGITLVNLSVPQASTLITSIASGESVPPPVAEQPEDEPESPFEEEQD